MKIYNLIGYSIIFFYGVGCMYFAPVHLGPWAGLLIGGAYFIFGWFMGGLYLADVLHLGIAHRALDYKEWFIKTRTMMGTLIKSRAMVFGGPYISVICRTGVRKIWRPTIS